MENLGQKSFPKDFLRKPYHRRVIPLSYCSHNHRLPCRANLSSPCPLHSSRFTSLLDSYCERFASRPSPDCSQIHSGKGDPVRQTVPPMMQLEVPSWFDDREALEMYARHRQDNKALRMNGDLCRAFQVAYVRWWTRLEPPGVRRPGAFMRGKSESEWARITSQARR